MNSIIIDIYKITIQQCRLHSFHVYINSHKDSSLPQQSGKSWALGALGSGPGWLRPRSLGTSEQAGASCLSSLTVWLGSAVLYRKLATDEVAVAGRSWGAPLGPGPCRLQSRDPLAIRETPFSSTRALESRPPSSSGLGEGEKDRHSFAHLSCQLYLFLHWPPGLPLQNIQTASCAGQELDPILQVGVQAWDWGVTCPGPHAGPLEDPGPVLCLWTPSPPITSLQPQLTISLSRGTTHSRLEPQQPVPTQGWPP